MSSTTNYINGCRLPAISSIITSSDCACDGLPIVQPLVNGMINRSPPEMPISVNIVL